MSDIERKINIQVYDNGVQISMVNGFNTTPMTRRELKLHIDDAIKAEHALSVNEIAKRPKLKVVGE